MIEATYISPIYTQMSWQDAAESLRAALRNYVQAVEPATLALAMAKTALESGRWGARPHAYKNWNTGNIKCGETYRGMFTCFACDEILPGRGRVWFEPDGREQDSHGWSQPIIYEVPDGHPQTRFRAYANRFDGCYQYIDFIAQGKRYKAAWQELLRGDATAYVHALKAAGYFTADEAIYRKGVVSLQQEFLEKLDGAPTSETVIEDHEWETLRVLVARDRIDDLGVVRAEALSRDLTGQDPAEKPPDDDVGF